MAIKAFAFVGGLAVALQILWHAGFPVVPHVFATAATSFSYRVQTTGKAFWVLYAAKPADLKPFYDSFVLWDRDASNTEAEYDAGVPLRPLVGNRADAGTVVDYYGTLNRLCALGNVEKMYIPPMVDKSKGVFDNQLIWEESFARKLNVGPGKRLLELGCGRGRITHHVHSQTGATITALNIEPDQLAAAEAFAASQGLNGTHLNFMRGNFNDDLPFPDETFDGMYQVQAMTYSTDLFKNFREIARVLKPDAILSILDGVMLEGYDPQNATHRKLLYETRQVSGLGGFWAPKYWTGAIEAAGFEIIEAGCPGGCHQYPLIERERWVFENLTILVKGLVWLRMLPTHFIELLERFTLHGDSFTYMDRQDMFTTAYAVIARKK